MGGTDTYGFSPSVSFLMGTYGDMHKTVSSGGYLVREGNLQPIVSASRATTRSSEGYPEQIVVDIVDEVGRTLHLVGITINRGHL
jgi:hypothetical protein